MEFIKSKLPFWGVMTSDIGGRKENQDTCGYSETDRGLLLVVCDGMGGGPGGKTASRIAVESIISYVQGSTAPASVSKEEAATESSETESGTNEDTEKEDAITKEDAVTQPKVTKPLVVEPIVNQQVLREAVEAANKALRDRIIKEPKLDGMGTTVTALLINADGVAVAHVGDSRIYQLRNKKIHFRTSDHSAVGEMVRRGILTEEQARLSANSNIITRALGIKDEIDVDTATLDFKPGDRFVLCTDGIWGSMPEKELIGSFCEKGDLDSVSRHINAKVQRLGVEKGGHHDNFSMIILLALKDKVAGADTNADKDNVARLNKVITGGQSGSKKVKFSPRIIALAVVLLIIGVSLAVFMNKTLKTTPPIIDDGKEQTEKPEEVDVKDVIGTDNIVDDTENKVTENIKPNTDPVDNGQAQATTNNLSKEEEKKTDSKGDSGKSQKTVSSEAESQPAVKSNALDNVIRSEEEPKAEVKEVSSNNEPLSEFEQEQKKCYQQTIEVLNDIRNGIGYLKDSKTNKIAQNSVRNLKRDFDGLKNKYKDKYKDKYTEEEIILLFGESGSIESGLGDKKLWKRDAGWEKEIDTPIKMITDRIDKLLNMLRPKLEKLKERSSN